MPAKTAHAHPLVRDVLVSKMTREIWTGNYDKALPVGVQDFDLSAVLPAVFYMFRFGHRRGKGKFIETFGPQEGTPKQRRQAATIERIADTLTQNGDKFEGFEDEIGKAILGDLLLCFCLDNEKYALGRKKQVQRVAPAHYMASWVDLPDSVADLRSVPEMIVAMLADQKSEHVQQNHDGGQTWFPVGKGYEENVLLRAFRQGIVQEGDIASNLKSDQFKEETSVGVDQILMIRLAQQLGDAPDKLRGSEGDKISNQHPIAEKAAKVFSEDIRRFVRSYASVIPRQAFVELLESCIAVGMTTILTSTVEILFEWGEKGEVCKIDEQKPARLFVDCSNGVNRRLRGLAEQSSDDLMRRLERFPVILMALRLLDHSARTSRKMKKIKIPTRPYATEWLNMLGELLHERRAEAQLILDGIDQKTEEVAEQLEQDYPEAAEMLRSESQDNPVWRLAGTLISLRDRKDVQGKLSLMIDSSLLSGRPNGLAAKRTTTRNVTGTQTRRRREIRSLVFTDSVLDYLVHLHVLASGKSHGVRPLPFKNFISTLRERYGFCVDVAPPGMTISNDLLQANRAILERRLRDLGLFVGVNDAEAMKRLEPRFGPTAED